MRKYLISGVLTALLVSIYGLALIQGPPSAEAVHDGQANWRMEHCRYQSVDPGYWTQREVHMLIHCAVEKWKESHSIADYVANRESKMLYNAYNASSGACGVYQHLSKFWGGRVAAYNKSHLGGLHVKDTRCFNARANVLVSLWMVDRGGWGPWGQ
jgi:hypothetical protein